MNLFQNMFSVATIRSSWFLFGPKDKYSGIALKLAKMFK